MMIRNILIGLGAGLAAALLFASVISGTTLAFPLFMLSPLPVAIAGIGFGTWSGAAAAGLAAALIGAAFNPLAGLLHLVVFGAPVAWAAHLVGLSRPVENAPAGVEWFPFESVLVRLAVAIGVAVIIAGILLGFDPVALATQTTSALESWLAASGAGADAPTAEQLKPLVSFNIALMPATTGCFALGIAVLNLWLGGHVARMSGLSRRGATAMWLVVMPSFAAAIFGVALVGAFLPGAVGQMAAALAGAVGFAFALTGFGALHALLRGRPGRFALLFLVYAVSIVFVLPIVAMALLGIVDTFTNFRRRRLAGASGPSS